MKTKYVLAALAAVIFLGLLPAACRKPDNDGMPADWEKKYHLNPYDPSDAEQDKDDDGLNNLQEYQFGSDPTKPDSDDDGILDPFEQQAGTSAKNPDTDGDGVPDGSDCMPLNPAISPHAQEGPIGSPSCIDTFDNDCDGAIDSTDPGCACRADSDCKSPDSCSSAVCENGACRLKPGPEGAVCDDRNCCTDQDRCRAGTCLGKLKLCPLNQACDSSSCKCSPQPHK